MRVESVGICGTDLSIHAGKIRVDYPRVMGHEIVGTVVSGGSDDEAGARVLVDPGIACGNCRQCREGRTNICTAGGLIGRDQDGGLRDLMPVPASNVHELPEGLDPGTAPMLQVLATCVHAQRRARVYPGESVVVLGLGVTGLLHVQLAKLGGAGPLIGVTRSAPKLALARELGADVTIAADGSETSEVAAALPGGADLVIECVGTVGAFARAIEMVRIGRTDPRVRHDDRNIRQGSLLRAVPQGDLGRRSSLGQGRGLPDGDRRRGLGARGARRARVGTVPDRRRRRGDRAAGAPGALKVFVDV